MSSSQADCSTQAKDGEDIKPCVDVVYRDARAKTGTAGFSTSQPFRSMPERRFDGKMFGVQTDLAAMNIKKDPDDSHKRDQCLCEINLRLSKQWLEEM